MKVGFNMAFFSQLVGKKFLLVDTNGTKTVMRLRKCGVVTISRTGGKNVSAGAEKFRLIGSTVDPEQTCNGPVKHHRIEPGQRLIADGPTGRFFVGGPIKTLQTV